MNSLILIFVCLSLLHVSEGIYSPFFYSKGMEQWQFAYKIISDIKIHYEETRGTYSLHDLINEPDNFTDERVFLSNSLDIDWNEFTDEDSVNQYSNTFILPLLSFQMTIAYNIPLLTSPLILTKDILIRMINNTQMTWNNDPELVALNPELQSVSSPVRMAFNGQINNMNQFLIDWVYKDYNITQETIGSWDGIQGGRIAYSRDWLDIGNSLSIGTNTLGFIPSPFLKYYTKLKFAHFYIPELNITVSPSDLPSFQTEILSESKTRITFLEQEDKWPLNIIGYLALNQHQQNCTDILENIRFLYWSLNESNLYDDTTNLGYRFFNNSFLLQRMSLLHCNEELLLTFENLSLNERSKVVSAACSTIIIISILGILYRFYLMEKKRREGMKDGSMKKESIFTRLFHTLIILFGQVLFLISIYIWYLPPNETWICITRSVLSGFGIVMILSSTFMYTFAIGQGFWITGLRVQKFNAIIFIVSILVILLEIFLKLLWVFIENPHSLEVVDDPIQWTSRYICYENNQTIEFIEYSFYFVIIIFGCVVVNHYWKKEAVLRIQDPRIMIGVLNAELLTIILLMLSTGIFNFTDETIYIIKVSLYSCCVVNISLGWIIPIILKHKWIKKGMNKTLPTQITSHTTVSDSEFSKSRRNSNSVNLKDLENDTK